MHISYDSKRLYLSDLPDLLSNCYSANTLWHLYSTIYLPTMGLKVPNKRVVKQEMVEDIVQLTKDPTQMEQFVAAFPDKLRATIDALLWVNFADATQLEKELGFPIYQFKQLNRKLWEEKPKVDKCDVAPELDLIVNHAQGYDYGLSRRFDAPTLSLPPALRSILRPHFPKPEGYQFKPLDELSNEPKGARHFDGSGDILTALSQLSDYLLRTKLVTTKTGKISKPTLRTIMKITAASEPFAADTAHKEFAELRHQLLIKWLLECTPKDLIDIAEGNKAPGTILREFVKAIVKDTDLIHDELLTHIKLKSAYFGHAPEQVDYSRNAVDLIFKQLPTKGWITRENIQRYQSYREIQIHTTATHRYYTKLQYGNDDDYAERMDIDSRTFTILLEHPLLDGLTFFFAAFGLLEIAFTPPANVEYCRPKKDYLTPFEGIYALRLTELGAYAFGHTKKLEIKASRANRAEMHFHPQRLHMRCVNLDPVTELTAKEFMEPISHTLFRLTRASLIGKANTLSEIKRRIQEFKRRIGQKLPENWLKFIDQLESEKPALNWRNSLGVYQLPDNPALRHAFSKDPKLRELCFKAEGWHVIVEQKDMSRLKERIRQLGFICE